MRQHIWGDQMAQYLPGEDPEPESQEDPHPIPALATLDHLIPRDDPDYVHVALSVHHLIKLGFGYTSRPVAQRRQEVMADAVLATEPGTMRLETVRHNQFREYRYQGERFYPGKALMAHIASLQSAE